MEEYIATALRDANLLQHFEALPPSHQKEYLKWIHEAKKTETKGKRIIKMIEMLRKK